MRKLIALSLVALLMVSSCTVVKEVEMIKLNDPDMSLSTKSIDRFEADFQTYREAAVGASGDKVGGGCGCN